MEGTRNLCSHVCSCGINGYNFLKGCNKGSKAHSHYTAAVTPKVIGTKPSKSMHKGPTMLCKAEIKCIVDPLEPVDTTVTVDVTAIDINNAVCGMLETNNCT